MRGGVGVGGVVGEGRVDQLAEGAPVLVHSQGGGLEVAARLMHENWSTLGQLIDAAFTDDSSDAAPATH